MVEDVSSHDLTLTLTLTAQAWNFQSHSSNNEKLGLLRKLEWGKIS